MKTIRTIDSLPNQVLIRIFELLSAPERIRLERVCKRWKAVSLRAWAKYRFISDDFCLYERPQNKRMNEFGELLKLSRRERSDVLKNVLSRGGEYVKSIEIESVISCNILFLVARFCPNLEVVQFSHITLSKYSLNSLALYCRNLKLIKFSFCFKSSNIDRELAKLFRSCIHLRSLELTSTEITGSCFCELPVEIKSLSLCLCHRLENEKLLNFASRCSRLEKIELNWCLCEITVQTVESFRNLLELHTVHLSYFGSLFSYFNSFKGFQLSMALSKLNHLTQLDLSWNRWVNDETLIIITGSLFNLCKLDISFCRNVTDAGLIILCRLQYLSNLNLQNCKRVTDEGVKSLAKLGRLEVLKLESCDKITDDSILELAKYCTNLTKLELFYCRKITTASILAFLDNVAKRYVCLRLYIPGSVRMKIKGLKRKLTVFGSVIIVSPLLTIVQL